MYDLNTINRLNAEAHAASIQTAQKAGLWVVAKYTGLHLVSTTTFNTADDARVHQANEEANRSPDEHFRRFDPISITPPRDLADDPVFAG